MRSLALIALLFLPLPASATSGSDGIHRCISPQGVSIYTDQPCADLGAADRIPPPAAQQPVIENGVIRSDCVRESQTLLFDLRRAIETDNINLLSGLYHWPGVSGGSAVGVMNRLERLMSRPMLSADLVYPEVAPVHENPEAFPEGTPPEDPIAVRIAQSEPGEIVGDESEELRLVRHAECWWLRFQ
jgi:hypothetical protein